MIAEINIEQATIDKLVEINGMSYCYNENWKNKEFVTIILEDGSVITLPRTENIKVY